MKLYRFTAPDHQKAIIKVHELIGPDALVYSTRRVHNGIEILAGLPVEENSHEEIIDGEKNVADELKVEDSSANQLLIQKMNERIRVMDENIQRLMNTVAELYQLVSDSAKSGDNIGKKWKFFSVFSRMKRNVKEGLYGTKAIH